MFEVLSVSIERLDDLDRTAAGMSSGLHAVNSFDNLLKNHMQLFIDFRRKFAVLNHIVDFLLKGTGQGFVFGVRELVFVNLPQLSGHGGADAVHSGQH